MGFPGACVDRSQHREFREQAQPRIGGVQDCLTEQGQRPLRCQGNPSPSFLGAPLRPVPPAPAGVASDPALADPVVSSQPASHLTVSRRSQEAILPPPAAPPPAPRWLHPLPQAWGFAVQPWGQHYPVWPPLAKWTVSVKFQLFSPSHATRRRPRVAGGRHGGQCTWGLRVLGLRRTHTCTASASFLPTRVGSCTCQPRVVSLALPLHQPVCKPCLPVTSPCVPRSLLPTLWAPAPTPAGSPQHPSE